MVALAGAEVVSARQALSFGFGLSDDAHVERWLLAVFLAGSALILAELSAYHLQRRPFATSSRERRRSTWTSVGFGVAVAIVAAVITLARVLVNRRLAQLGDLTAVSPLNLALMVGFQLIFVIMALGLANSHRRRHERSRAALRSARRAELQAETDQLDRFEPIRSEIEQEGLARLDDLVLDAEIRYRSLLVSMFPGATGQVGWQHRTAAELGHKLDRRALPPRTSGYPDPAEGARTLGSSSEVGR
jgi:uncharacterized membrane protein YidH (DUF202 family)